MADPRAVEISPEDACDDTIVCQVVACKNGRTVCKSGVVFNVDRDQPFPFWITDIEGENPLHLRESELVRIRLICPNCESPFWVTDVEDDMDGDPVQRKVLQCYDCGWEGVPSDDYSRYRP